VTTDIPPRRSSRCIRLDRLQAQFGRLTPIRGAAYAEAAKVVLDLTHKSPTELEVRTAAPEIAMLHWSPPQQEAGHAWADVTEAIEDGACAIALLVAEFLYDFVVHARAQKKTGCDFYLVKEGTTSRMFQPPSVRLEVSGIGVNTQQSMTVRVRTKLEQVQRGGSSPYLVIVVDFSKPQSVVEHHGLS
jgi:hypothetical protein